VPAARIVLAQAAQVKPFEHAQHALHRGGPGRRRPHAADLVRAVERADRRALLHLVPGDVRRGHRCRIARRQRDGIDDLLRVGAGVERIRSLCRDLFEEGGQFRVFQRGPRRQRRAIRLVIDGAASLGQRGAGFEPGQECGEARGDGEPFTRQPDRWLEQRRPRQLAMRAVCLGHQANVARNADAAPAGDGLRHAERFAIDIEPGSVGCRRGGFPAVIGLDPALAVIMDQESAAADAGALRFDHGQRQQRGQRGIGGRAAGAQDLCPCRCRARVGGADHALFKARGRCGAIGVGTRASSQQERRGGECDQFQLHGRGSYSVPTASAMVANPSRRIRRSSPRVIWRAMPGPA